ncbi:Rrf2 family transcriptional regulator [Robiginitalea sp. SC105]|uniref:RrF2 family transcriptional regulator n=1 Tax=Robiginitalea sp. SC105 TaxID=2762332 RepID=UPI00163AC17A|nr:Rrf2 family transcriptional regulator [Robiginitalea sp. SC105]MBC2839295.1 Rrf2 family transcriptional regulator [Robiginitalea sp. SC105]
MLSKSSKYAIKAAIYLALNTDKDKKVLVRDMHQKVNVSESYLAKLLQELSRHGIISSTKGRGGGFYTTDSNRQRTLMDIVKVIDGPDNVNACVLGIAHCDMSNPCALHHLVGPGKSAFNSVLENTTLQKLAEDYRGEAPYFPL